MNTDDTGRLLYLGLLLMALIGSFLMGNRQSLGKTAQQASIWAFIFLGAIAVVGLWPEISRQIQPQKPVSDANGTEIRAASDGHYYVDTLVNGTTVRFVIDTGASAIVLTARDAERVGLNPKTLAYTGQATTANGKVLTAPVRLKSLVLGPFEDQNVPAVVNGRDLDTSLLGVSYLGLFQITFSSDRLVLKR